MDRPPQVVAIGRNAHGFVPTDRYRLPDLWSLHLYDYDAVLRLDGREVAIERGSVGVTPPGVLMETRYFGVSVHVYAHFRLDPGPSRPIRAVGGLGDAFGPMFRDLHEAAVQFSREPRWADARVWNALWTAARSADPRERDSDLHPAVRRATEIVERRLDGPISVAGLAAAVGVDPSYLARLFRAAYGESVVGHVRRLRMERASHLLQRSTLPIKLVAAAVGFADLQAFNKAARAAFGVGPREWRRLGRERS